MQQVAIANGASTSSRIELKGHVSGIYMPAAWTAAQITLEGSVDGENFQPCYDASGLALIVEAAAGRYIKLPESATKGIRYLRLRSGTVAAPVNQGAARDLKLEVIE